MSEQERKKEIQNYLLINVVFDGVQVLFVITVEVR
jgi:hypothetical protein